MLSAHANQVDLSITPYYRCTARCVRRAYLCGNDKYTGENLNKRKRWIVERIHFVADVFAIDVCAYAVMNNHLHLILHVDEARAQQWSDDEIIRRYCSVYSMAQDAYEKLTTEKQRRAKRQEWRARLASLPKMVGAINEYIARRANKEDGERGRFWEGRSKYQALLDNEGLVLCMSYVDLSLQRARVDSGTVAGATSMQKRLADEAERKRTKKRKPKATTLAAFADQNPNNDSTFQLPFAFPAYTEVIDWATKALRAKEGKLPPRPPELLVHQGVSLTGWVASLTQSNFDAASCLGAEKRILELAERKGKGWLRGIGIGRQLTAD